ERSIWHRLATAAMARPWHLLVLVVLILIVLGLPFRHLHLGTPDITTLPHDAESRRGEELLGREFPQLSPTSIVVLVSYPDATGLTPARVDELYTLSRWLARQPGVTRVESVVDLDPRITLDQYKMMATAPREMLPPPMREAFEQMTGPRLSLLVVQTALPVDGQGARDLVKTIRRAHAPVAAQMLVTGRTAYDLDFAALVWRVAPGAVTFVLGAALIMATVFFGFGVARTVMIKEMGIGMGIAIVMDATIIRALLVPATMRLLGDWNWWAPRSLRRLWERLRAPVNAL